MRKPWDQLEGEPDAAYGRFLAYLCLGPRRSIDAAAKAANGSKKGRRAGGAMFAESKRWEWVARSEAWDIEQFRTVGYLGIKRLAEAIEAAGERLIAALPALQPENWSQALETLHVLSSIIPPETLAALLAPRGEWPGQQHVSPADASCLG